MHFCESGDHSTNKCTRVLDVTSMRDILIKKGVYFNCASAGHRVSHCRWRPCFKYGQKHHASICELTHSSRDQLSTVHESSWDKMKQETRAQEQSTEKGMSSMTESSSTIHPTLLATVREETIRIMVDIGANSSYVWKDLITKLRIKSVRRGQHCIEQMYGTMKKAVEMYK